MFSLKKAIWFDLQLDLHYSKGSNKGVEPSFVVSVSVDLGHFSGGHIFSIQRHFLFLRGRLTCP